MISNVTVTPTFGIASLSTFNFTAFASDPDGDSVTYAWDLAGNASNGASQSVIFSNGFSGAGTVVVSDGKGGSATSLVNFTVGSMTGSWVMTTGPGVLAGSRYQFTQNGGIFSGTFTIPAIGDGRTDPAQPGSINAAAQVAMRGKIGIFIDFNLVGAMDTTGQRITGGVQGSGFTGQPFVLTKQ